MKPITIILVDDHEILMDGMAALLNDIPGLTVIDKCTSVSQAIAKIKLHSPNLVITDISIGVESGLDLTRQIAREFPLVRIMVLSMHDTHEHVHAMMEAGANAYLLKNVKKPDLIKAIEMVMNGEEYIQQEMVNKYKLTADEKPGKPLLSAREIEIIRLIAQEFSTTEISSKLFISQFTVETHRKNILRKTGCKTVIGLLNYAREHQLL